MNWNKLSRSLLWLSLGCFILSILGCVGLPVSYSLSLAGEDEISTIRGGVSLAISISFLVVALILMLIGIISRAISD